MQLNFQKDNTNENTVKYYASRKLIIKYLEELGLNQFRRELIDIDSAIENVRKNGKNDDKFLNLLTLEFGKIIIKINTEIDKLLGKKLSVEESKKRYFKYKLVMKLKSECKVNFWAHNGGRYDHFFILKNCTNVKNIIMKGGILMMEIFEHIRFVDFYKHCAFKLSKLCEDFEIDKELSKTEFPHDFINETKDINYIGPVPEEKYWPDGKIPEEHQNKIFDLKKVSIEYQKKDVIALQQVYKKYSELIHKITGLSANKYLTSPSLAYINIKNHITTKYDINIIKNIKINKNIRKAAFGGRTFVQKSYYENENFNKFIDWDNKSEDEKLELYNSIDNFLVDFDATSLYPSAMALYKYPIGKSKVLPDNEFDRIMNDINNLKYNKYCIVKCDIEYTNRHEIICPLIPTKNKTGRITYDMIDKKEIWVSNVDLEETIKHNNGKINKSV